MPEDTHKDFRPKTSYLKTDFGSEFYARPHYREQGWHSSFICENHPDPTTELDYEETEQLNKAHRLLTSLLLKRLEEIAVVHLTSHQHFVWIQYTKENKTLQQIGDMLIAQQRYHNRYTAYTAVNNSFNGIKKFRKTGEVYYEGGIKTKLVKISKLDKQFLELARWRSKLNDPDGLALFLRKHSDV